MTDDRIKEVAQEIITAGAVGYFDQAEQALRDFIAEASGTHIGYQLFDHSGRPQGQPFKAASSAAAKQLAQQWSSQSGNDGGPFEAREIRAVPL